MSEKVTFYSEGIKLAGLLYLPDIAKDEKRPGIVVCYGFGGLKEGTPVAICQYLAKQGYVCLSLDYRGFGESEGVRGRIDPWGQCTDIQSAITFLQHFQNVRPDQIGLYGTSYGGGNVSYVAAVDKRVKCTVATIPVGNGERWMRSIRRNFEWMEMVDRVKSSMERSVLSGELEMVDRYEIMVPDPKTKEYYDQFFEQFPEQRTPVTIDSFDYVISFKPEDYVAEISPRPIMYIHADRDYLVSPENSVRLYDRANEPKRLEFIKDINHFDVYSGKPFEEVMKFSLDWYNQYLPIES